MSLPTLTDDSLICPTMEDRNILLLLLYKVGESQLARARKKKDSVTRRLTIFNAYIHTYTCCHNQTSNVVLYASNDNIN